MSKLGDRVNPPEFRANVAAARVHLDRRDEATYIDLGKRLAEALQRALGNRQPCSDPKCPDAVLAEARRLGWIK